MGLMPILPPPSVHPLAPLTGPEMIVVRDIVRKDGRFGKAPRFPGLWLDEPSKAEWAAGRPPRRAFASIYVPSQNQTFEALIDLRGKRIVSRKAIPGVQPLVLMNDYAVADEIVRKDPQWIAAMRRRGLTKIEDLHLEPWAPGYVEGDQPPRRLMRVLTFLRGKSENPYARPIEGVLALVDLNARRMVRLEDTGNRPLPPEAGPIGTPNPGRSTAPAKPPFALKDHAVAWGPWRFRYALHPREGLVIHLAEIRDGKAWRKVLHRASLSEMAVPYGDPDPQWRWRSAFDVGEYGVGLLATSLVPGGDVPSHATLRDEILPTDDGTPKIAPRAVALYERDGGVLQRHWDLFTDRTVSRRAKELVVCFMAAIGNYDYLISYVFREDGAIKVECDLTGMMLPKGVARVSEGRHSESATGHLVAPRVEAVNHQHWFSFRLDLDVDGAANNSVLQSETRPIPSEPGNAFGMREAVLESESGAGRQLDLATARRWRVVNPGRRNALGGQPGYMLVPGENSVPYARPGSAERRRAGFLDHHLWVTRYRPEERYAAGNYPNLSNRTEGLPEYVGNDEPLASEDVVLWYTMGVTHIPRPEDWPLMPAHRTGFTLIPVGFFTRNPTLGGAGG
ncbi:MAG: hypothetical protein ACO1SV_06830 [Fimbriimonas sp.]